MNEELKLIDEIDQSIHDAVDQLCIQLEKEPCFFKELLIQFADNIRSAGAAEQLGKCKEEIVKKYPYPKQLAVIRNILAALEASAVKK
jgi:hypothetical protein